MTEYIKPKISYNTIKKNTTLASFTKSKAVLEEEEESSK